MIINENTTLREIKEHYDKIRKISPEIRIIFDNGFPKHFLERSGE